MDLQQDDLSLIDREHLTEFHRTSGKVSRQPRDSAAEISRADKSNSHDPSSSSFLLCHRLTAPSFSAALPSPSSSARDIRPQRDPIAVACPVGKLADEEAEILDIQGGVEPARINAFETDLPGKTDHHRARLVVVRAGEYRRSLALCRIADQR